MPPVLFPALWTNPSFLVCGGPNGEAEPLPLKACAKVRIDLVLPGNPLRLHGPPAQSLRHAEPRIRLRHSFKQQIRETCNTFLSHWVISPTLNVSTPFILQEPQWLSHVLMQVRALCDTRVQYGVQSCYEIRAIAQKSGYTPLAVKNVPAPPEDTASANSRQECHYLYINRNA